MLHFGLYCQTQEDSINGYLGEINKLVEEYDSHPEEFLNSDFLVAKVNSDRRRRENKCPFKPFYFIYI